MPAFAMEVQPVVPAPSTRLWRACSSESQVCLGLDRVYINGRNVTNLFRTKAHLRFPNTCLACRQSYRCLHEKISPSTGRDARSSLASNSYENVAVNMDQPNPVKLRELILCQTPFTTSKTSTGNHSAFSGDGSTMTHSLAVALATPPLAPGWLSLGVCGNALIARVGNDRRCFHQAKHGCEHKNWDEQDCPMDARRTQAVLNASQSSLIDLVRAERTIEVMPLKSSIKSMITKRNQLEKGKITSAPRQKKQGKVTTPARDLFGRSSFHLCEIIFCSPFTSSNLVSNLRCFSKESLKDLVAILNTVAVGLAGTGVALMLFMASRMLAVNSTLTNHMIIDVVCGLGFISSAWAIKRVADVVCCMADASTKSRSPKKETLIRLQNALQRFAFQTFPLIVLCVVRFG